LQGLYPDAIIGGPGVRRTRQWYRAQQRAIRDRGRLPLEHGARCVGNAPRRAGQGVIAEREDWMGCRRATAVLTPQSVNTYAPSHVHLVYGVLA
jgi:hypothetical protein